MRPNNARSRSTFSVGGGKLAEELAGDHEEIDASEREKVLKLSEARNAWLLHDTIAPQDMQGSLSFR